MATPRKANPQPGGRPSLYRDHFAEQVYKLALLGATDEEIAGFFDVALNTMYRWNSQHPEFKKSREKGKLEADANVAHSTYRRAVGYSHAAVKIFLPSGSREPVYAEYTEHYPPDTQAGTWWLKNRRKQDWQDQHNHQHSGTITWESLVQQSVEQIEPPTIEHESQGDNGDK